MKVHISFKVINQEYNKDYANEYHFGKESENNTKYLSEATYSIPNIKSVELLNEGTFKLILRVSSGNKTEITIPNVVIFRCHIENGTYLDFAVSKSVLNKTHQAHNEKYETTRCYFYINSEPESIALTDNLVIDVNEIPKNFKDRI